MPRHVVVDGSNLATEGRSLPSLQQLVDAVQAFMEENPHDLITVVVDATFGHRIDPRELAEFDAAIEHNEIVAPPAGAVGRGDAFVLAIANKVHATIISNDSYQEFHGEHTWLFDEGRLIGGKPVPHVGWVFVPRVPVRGPLSRKVTREAKRRPASTRTPAAPATPAGRPSRSASLPMPVPSAPPPVLRVVADAPAETVEAAAVAERPSRRRGRSRVTDTAGVAAVAASPAAEKTDGHSSTHVATPNKSAMVNDLLPFLGFVEHHPVTSTVEAVVESYASHGAYVTIGDARGYVPLRLMADPAPRSAREVMKLNESVTLHVAAFHPSRRGIDLATPNMAHLIELGSTDDADDEPIVPASARARRSPRRGAKPEVVEVVETATVVAEVPPPAKRTAKRATKAVAAAAPQPQPKPEPTVAAPAKRSARKTAAVPVEPPVVASPPPAKKAAKRPAKAAAAAPVPVAAAAPKKAAAKRAATPKPAPVIAPAKAPAKSPAKSPAKKAAAKPVAPAEPPAPAKQAAKKAKKASAPAKPA